MAKIADLEARAALEEYEEEDDEGISREDLQTSVDELLAGMESVTEVLTELIDPRHKGRRLTPFLLKKIVEVEAEARSLMDSYVGLVEEGEEEDTSMNGVVEDRDIPDMHP